MLTKLEFKKEFIARMTEIMGQYEAYFEFAATSAYSNYEKDPDDMTPDEHAEDEISEWGR